MDHVVAHSHHFRPDYDLNFFAPHVSRVALSGLSTVFNDAKKDRLETDLHQLDAESIGKMSDWEIQAVRNYIYATVGYTFSNREWKAYFEKQGWYWGFPGRKKPEDRFDATQAGVMSLLQAEERRRKK